MDIADRADDEIERNLAEALRKASKPLDPGTPGDCELCGEWTGRLVGGACALCRDHYRMP